MKRAGRLLGGLTVAGLLAACAQVPHAGPVVEAKERQQLPPVQGQYSNPRGPQPGDSPQAIVTGFFVAMTAIPLQTTSAQDFLSKRAQEQWRPQKRVVTYVDHTAALSVGDHVVVRLNGPDQVGAGGQWQGPVTGQARRLRFRMVREDGQWRIARAPDALMVPRTFFDQQYQTAQIYFVDPTSRLLVPEPVHVPAGSQLASALVNALVRGPGRSLSGVSRNYIPSGLEPPVSVPIGNNGVADVTLTGPDPGPLSRTTTQLILAQFEWTLSQDPEIRGFRLSIAGHQLAGSTGAQSFRVESQSPTRFDPAWFRASSQYYAIRRGRLVSGPINHLTKVIGPFGRQALGIGQFAVSLDSLTVAAVGPSSLLVGPVQDSGRPVPVLTGTGLLRPAWDFAKRLWEVQDRADGAHVVCVAGRARSVHIPGITGEDVRRFLVSRDGSRFIAVLRGEQDDRIVVSRLRYDIDGHVTGATRPVPIPWSAPGARRIRDIGWTSPTTIAVLDQVSPTQAEVRILNVDGSSRPAEVSPIQITGRVLGLATSPGQQTPYAVQSSGRSSGESSGESSGLFDISPAETNRTVSISGLHHLTYAG